LAPNSANASTQEETEDEKRVRFEGFLRKAIAQPSTEATA